MAARQPRGIASLPNRNPNPGKLATGAAEVERDVVARILAVAVAMSLAASGAALACQGKVAAALDDSFKTPDPGWGPPDNGAAFTPGGLALKPPVNGSA